MDCEVLVPLTKKKRERGERRVGGEGRGREGKDFSCALLVNLDTRH